MSECTHHVKAAPAVVICWALVVRLFDVVKVKMRDACDTCLSNAAGGCACSFFTGGGPSEAEEAAAGGAGDEGGAVTKRLLIGLALTAAVGAFALVPTQQLAPKPPKPLFFYLVSLAGYKFAVLLLSMSDAVAYLTVLSCSLL